jgi:predicted transcriptional regulator
MILRKHDVENCFRVDVIHRELPPVPPFVVGWEFPLMTLRPELNPDAMKQAKAGRRKTLDPKTLCAGIIDTTAENPTSINAWAKAAGVPRQTLTDYLPELRRKGWIATTGEGSSARQFITTTGLEMMRNGKGET